MLTSKSHRRSRVFFVTLLATLLIEQTEGSSKRVMKRMCLFDCLGLPFNQPSLCPSATWNSFGETLVDICSAGALPSTTFVNVENSLYVTVSDHNRVDIWTEGDVNLTKSISSGLIQPQGIFVGNSGDVFIDNAAQNGRVDRWTSNGTNIGSVMNVNGSCYSLFIDMNDTLYCSTGALHQVVKRSLSNNSSLMTMKAAGDGTMGASSGQLSSPHGIFVDINFQIYVADYGNNRIQRFLHGQFNASTMSTMGIFALNQPTAVILDGNGYMFIADSSNHRILGSGPAGFRCVVGCTGTSGSAPDQLSCRGNRAKCRYIGLSNDSRDVYRDISPIYSIADDIA